MGDLMNKMMIANGISLTSNRNVAGQLTEGHIERTLHFIGEVVTWENEYFN